MATRLSGLLERIRPSGTPGAPGEAHTDRDAVAEIADVAALLQEFRSEAGRATVDALDRSDEIRRDTESTIEALRTELPTRLAAVRAEESVRPDDPAVVAIEHETKLALRELDERAAASIPELVQAAVERIWSSVATSEEPP